MSKLEYITTRILKNSSGEEKGKIRIIKFEEEGEAQVNYTCPECLYTENRKETWKKPFSIRCAKCNFLIRVSKLKDEIKKLRKQK
jgi:ssDNA-binding Zn-finger/Zn-ribbon topoisomerase 1